MGLAIGNGDALRVVNVQRDLLAGADPVVREGKAVVPVRNRFFSPAERKTLPVLAGRDRHPPKQPASSCSCWNTRFVQSTSSGAKALAPGMKFVTLECAASPATR